MGDQEKESFDFIREKIKEKPLNKKRMLKQGVFTVALAVLFGVTACAVFTYLQKKKKNSG